MTLTTDRSTKGGRVPSTFSTIRRLGLPGALATVFVACGTPDTPGDETNGAWSRAPVEGGELEYTVRGDGEPVLLIHGSHVADAFLPLAGEPALDDYQLIRYHRRGFAGSAAHDGPFSIADQAADARAVLRHLGVSRAHLVGHSYGAVTALQLAHEDPDVVHSVSLLEPPLLMVPSAEAVNQALGPSFERYESGDAAGAVEAFMQVIGGSEWRAQAARTVPGGAEQAEADAATWFEVEAPALGEWQFDADAAGEISAPILYVRGGESGPFFVEGGDLVQTWFPQAEDEVIEGATHLLQMQEPRAVAEAIADFLAEHPMEI